MHIFDIVRLYSDGCGIYMHMKIATVEVKCFNQISRIPTFFLISDIFSEWRDIF